MMKINISYLYLNNIQIKFKKYVCIAKNIKLDDLTTINTTKKMIKLFSKWFFIQS